MRADERSELGIFSYLFDLRQGVQLMDGSWSLRRHFSRSRDSRGHRVNDAQQRGSIMSRADLPLLVLTDTAIPRSKWCRQPLHSSHRFFISYSGNAVCPTVPRRKDWYSITIIRTEMAVEWPHKRRSCNVIANSWSGAR